MRCACRTRMCVSYGADIVTVWHLWWENAYRETAGFHEKQSRGYGYKTDERAFDLFTV